MTVSAKCSKVGISLMVDDSFAIDSGDVNWGGFGIYIAYIFTFVIFTFFLDKFKVCDRWVHELSLKSQEHLHPYVLRQRHVDLEDSNRKNAEHESQYEGECCDCLFGGKERCSSEISQYKVEYLSYLLDAPVYLAVAPVESTAKDETVINLCWCWPIRIAPKLFRTFYCTTLASIHYWVCSQLQRVIHFRELKNAPHSYAKHAWLWVLVFLSAS